MCYTGIMPFLNILVYDVVYNGVEFYDMKLAGVLIVCIGFVLVLFPANWSQILASIARYTNPGLHCQVYKSLITLPGIQILDSIARYTNPWLHCQLYKSLIPLPGIQILDSIARYTNLWLIARYTNSFLHCQV